MPLYAGSSLECHYWRIFCFSDLGQKFLMVSLAPVPAFHVPMSILELAFLIPSGGMEFGLSMGNL